MLRFHGLQRSLQWPLPLPLPAGATHAVWRLPSGGSDYHQ